MPRKSFRDRLEKLFSTQVVVRRTGKGKIKVVDTSKLQTVGNIKGRNTGYFSSLHSTRNYFAPSHGSNYFATRLHMYRDYEVMDHDSILGSALDIYADETTIKNAEGDLLIIKTKNNKIKDILHNLYYDILNVENSLWPMVRNACKYGDAYWILDLDSKLGVVNVTPVGSYDMERKEGEDPTNPYKVQFEYNPSQTTIHPATSQKAVYEYYEVAHFRLLSDTNFLPYGKSMLEGARKEFKRLTLMEDAMMIHRIMRAPQRRVYKVAVGSLGPNEIEGYMKKIINSTKKIPYIDERTGDYNLKFNLQNMIEDIYIPTRGGQAQTEVETLDGMSNDGFIEDVEYIRNKMMAYLKIPKAFLGYDENLEGKAVLAAEDVRFARTIERLQNIFVAELTKIGMIHLFLQGYEDEELVDFEIQLNSPSIVYKRQQVEILTEQANLAQMLKDSKLMSLDFIYKNVFSLSDDEIKEMKDQLVEDQEFQNRLNQIEQEGNDPEETGEIVGTPHSLAQLQSQGGDEEGFDELGDEEGFDYDEEGFEAEDNFDLDKALNDTDYEEPEPEDDEEETRGRKKSNKKFGTKRDKSNGRDPLGDRNTQANLGFSSRKESVQIKTMLKELSSRYRRRPLHEILDHEELEENR